MNIRLATLEDAAEIANVHINSWREAYKDLLPSSFLDDRPLMFKNRYELWKKIVINEDYITIVAESEAHGVVGFINGKNGRDENIADYAEIWSFYLLKKYHGQKIGFNLLQKFFELQRARGFKKAYLWVLENNPTISFYEKSGGHFNGLKKEDEIGGTKVNELCYIWNSI
jgi:ribosomal protein S18 acetylase RimI-like enzyme